MEKRLYAFSHFMLSPMAKGIQTLHSTVELFNKYVPNPSNDDYVSVIEEESEDAYSILWDWSLNHKTVISLNGGISEDLDNLHYLLEDIENFYPWAPFYEDKQSLKGLMTSISLVLPEKIYNTASYFKSGNFYFDISLGKLFCSDFKKTTQLDLEIIESYGRFSNFEIKLIETISMYKLAS